MGISGYASESAVIGTTTTFTILSAITVLLRLVTRIRVVHNTGLDDLFIAGALVCSILLTACACVAVRHRVGHHQETTTEHDSVTSLKASFAAMLTYNCALIAIKLSILLQYLRFFPQRRFRIACYAMIVIDLVYTSWCFWSSIFFCTPVAAFWMKGPSSGQCFNRTAVGFANAAINILTDIATAILPLPLLCHLNIPKSQKVGLMVVFALGAFTCVISALRLEALYAETTSPDLDYNGGQAIIWSTLEVNIGIICSCLPTLKAPAARFLPRLWSSRQQTTPGSSIAMGPLTTTTAYGKGTKLRADQEEWEGKLDSTIEPLQRVYVTSRAKRQSRDMHLGGLEGPKSGIMVITSIDQDFEPAVGEAVESEQGGTWQAFEESAKRGSEHGSTQELVARKPSDEGGQW